MVKEQGLDERKTFRCPVKPFQAVEFQVESDVLPALLVDESAGGFSILVRDPPELIKGQTALLQAATGSFHVSIVHVQEVISQKGMETESENESEETEPGQWYRLGLCRLGEAASAQSPGISLWFRSLWRRSDPRRSMRILPFVVLGTVLAIVAVALPLGLRHWTGGKASLDFKPSQTQHHSSASSAGSKGILTIGTTSKPSREVKSESPSRTVSNGAALNNSETTRIGVSTVSPEARAAARLPGATPFQLPEVVELLQLTEDQAEKIERLVDATYESVRNLMRESQGQQRGEIAQQRQELFEKARQQVMTLLTDQQRTQWQEYTEGR